MTMEIAQALINLGALGVIVYLFVAGKLVSEETVTKLMEAQANHISDLKGVMEEKLNKMINILEEIRENGAMTKKRK